MHLRHATTHDVPACWFEVDRFTITRAVGEVRPLLAERGCTIAPGVRLRTLAEVIDHLGASGKSGIIDGTEVPVHRPAVGRTDREAFISGKTRQNAVKTMVAPTPAAGCCSAARPGRAAARTSPTPANWGWPSSWPTGRPWRPSPTPATGAWARRPADA
nr:transposase family protein [Streptomyces radiopugnans]